MHDDLRRKQLVGIALSLAALAVVVAVGLNARRWFAAGVPADDPASRLAFVARWLLAPGCMLFAGVFSAARRGFHADAIDGTRTPASRGLEIALRYNQNTVEQALLAAIAWLGLAVTLPRDALAFIPAMAVLFVVGRLTFWIGYLVMPIARAFGMTLTVVPSIAAYLWLLAHALGSGR